MSKIGLGGSDADDLLAKADWDDLSHRLTLHAFKRLRRKSRELAQEFAQTAIERVLDTKRGAPWDPERDPDLFLYLGSIVNTLVWNHVNSSAAKAQRGKMTEAERIADDAVSAEDQLVSKDRAARIAKALREHLRAANDLLCLKIIELMMEGIEKPQDLADAAKVHVDEIYKAKKRLNAALAHVMRELGEEDDDGQ